MTTEALKLQAALLEIEQLKNQLKQTEGAVESQKHTAALKQQDWLAEMDAAAELRAQAMFEQKQVLDADKAERKKAPVFTRPKTMTEYRALTAFDRSKVIGLFGQELVCELLEKESRENAAYRTAQRLRGRL